MQTPLQVSRCPWETINKPLLLFPFQLRWVSIRLQQKSIYFGWCHAHLDVRVKNGVFQMCITVLCHKMLPKMYQIIPKMYFLAINGKKKKSFLWKTSYSALHIVDKLGEEANMWFILLCRADCKAILISLSGGDGDQSIQMEAVFLRFLFNSNEKWQHSYYWPYRKMYRLLHFTLG